MRWTLATALALAMGAPASAQTLFEEMAETGRFEHFLEGVEAAGIEDLLTGPAPVTVLAPTDEAYERFVGPRLRAAFEDDPGLARLVIETHIAEGAAHEADDMPRTLDVANGETVTVRWTGGSLLATVDGGTKVSETVEIEGGDVRSGNGIAHPISGLLLPRNATLDALADPDGPEAGPAPLAEAPAATEPAGDEAPVPSDGSYLDGVVEGADRGTIERAPVEEPSSEEVTVLTTDEDAASEEDVIVLTPTEEEAATSAARPSGASSTGGPAVAVERAERGAEAAAEAAAALAPGARGEGADVVVEEMNVTVEAEPRVEPRTVAPSRMMDGPAASEPEPEPEPAAEGAQATPPDGRAADAAASEDGPEEAVLSTAMIGWSVYGRDGEEVGEVEDVIILQDTGVVDGVLVEVGGFLGTALGSHLVRVHLDELRIDVADEALVAEIAGGDITQRQEYAGPELRP